MVLSSVTVKGDGLLDFSKLTETGEGLFANSLLSATARLTLSNFSSLEIIGGRSLTISLSSLSGEGVEFLTSLHLSNLGGVIRFGFSNLSGTGAGF